MKRTNKEIHHRQQRLKVVSPIITIYDQDVVDEVEGVQNSHLHHNSHHHNNNHRCHHYSRHHKDWCHHKQEAYNLPL
jgi:hypothetical protein